MSAKTRDIFVGIDSGTQSTKVLLVDGDTGRVLASAAAPHQLIENLPPGHLEQDPQMWFEALQQALREALRSDNVDPKQIRAIGVSGQQHGFVPLDAEGSVIRPAKLWCDTSTAAQCDQIVDAIGGLARFIELTGNPLPPGFTASKISWLKQNEPEDYSRLHTVLLPHDYLNFRLTGEPRMECGDASGTALMDVRRRTWCEDVISAIDADLLDKLPPLIPNDEPCGTLMTELADKWGMSTDVLVSAGGGDNMMSAIGTGNVTEGVVTVSLGTSGTIFAYADQPIVDPQGDVAAFCDSTGAWLPLICTMNVTVATELTKALFAGDNRWLERAVNAAAPGCDGLLLIPYFDGERTPNVPSGTGVWFGANRSTHTPAHFARAAMEGATLGLCVGLARLSELGVRGTEIRLTGGGSHSPAWRRIAADVFGLPVVCLEQSESAAFGAAMQAKWCRQKRQSASASIRNIAAAWAKPVEATRMEPDEACRAMYRELGDLHARVSLALRDAFDAHRNFITRRTQSEELPE